MVSSHLDVFDENLKLSGSLEAFHLDNLLRKDDSYLRSPSPFPTPDDVLLEGGDTSFSERGTGHSLFDRDKGGMAPSLPLSKENAFTDFVGRQSLMVSDNDFPLKPAINNDDEDIRPIFEDLSLLPDFVEFVRWCQREGEDLQTYSPMPIATWVPFFNPPLPPEGPSSVCFEPRLSIPKCDDAATAKEELPLPGTPPRGHYWEAHVADWKPKAERTGASDGCLENLPSRDILLDDKEKVLYLSKMEGTEELPLHDSLWCILPCNPDSLDEKGSIPEAVSTPSVSEVRVALGDEEDCSSYGDRHRETAWWESGTENDKDGSSLKDNGLPGLSGGNTAVFKPVGLGLTGPNPPFRGPLPPVPLVRGRHLLGVKAGMKPSSQRVIGEMLRARVKAAITALPSEKGSSGIYCHVDKGYSNDDCTPVKPFGVLKVKRSKASTRKGPALQTTAGANKRATVKKGKATIQKGATVQEGGGPLVAWGRGKRRSVKGGYS
eukprot:TRINITY_DN9896_c0_g1_i1.p1 TRINITY_DN9896_c0_g1~~TRINITY_DN9896_c0_g1_i1.p1  ORF type:complete len:491 (+),score=49.44 TRINITY_DN9896_c0_g1_i1:297-1769(+)